MGMTKEELLHHSSPIFRDPADQLWYYWDETGTYRFGPYADRAAVAAALARYTQHLNRVADLSRWTADTQLPPLSREELADWDNRQLPPGRLVLSLLVGSVVSVGVVGGMLWLAVQIAKHWGWLQ